MAQGDVHLGQGERRCTPLGIVGHPREDQRGALLVQIPLDERRGVEDQRQRLRCSRRISVDDGPGARMGSGGNGGAVARGPSSNPAPMRSAIDAGWSPVFNGPNCAAGFPSIVMMIRSPAIARRIAPLVWFRRSRMPIRSTPETVARVDTCSGHVSLKVASPVSGPTRDRRDPYAASGWTICGMYRGSTNWNTCSSISFSPCRAVLDHSR